jgi:hypothetical protein
MLLLTISATSMARRFLSRMNGCLVTERRASRLDISSFARTLYPVIFVISSHLRAYFATVALAPSVSTRIRPHLDSDDALITGRGQRNLSHQFGRADRLATPPMKRVSLCTIRSRSRIKEARARFDRRQRKSAPSESSLTQPIVFDEVRRDLKFSRTIASFVSSTRSLHHGRIPRRTRRPPKLHSKP